MEDEVEVNEVKFVGPIDSNKGNIYNEARNKWPTQTTQSKVVCGQKRVHEHIETFLSIYLHLNFRWQYVKTEDLTLFRIFLSCSRMGGGGGEQGVQKGPIP